MRYLKLKDRTFTLADFDERLAKQILAWCKDKLPDPLIAIKDILKDFPPKLQAEMVKEAMTERRMPLTLDNPQVQALLKTPEGLEQVMMLMFKRHHPELTPEQVWAIHKDAVNT